MDKQLKLTVLIDNIGACDLKSEWGLSVYITYNGKNYLLDGGTTGTFIDNAEKLGIDIKSVDYAVLSHMHYDHADGLPRFLDSNDHAPLLLREGAAENCYHSYWFWHKYIGMKKGVLTKYADRIRYVSGDYQVEEGVYIIPHKTEGLEKIGKKAHMSVRKGMRYVPDDFSHEQSLVFDTDKGLVIFNSCSHGGADNIIKEVAGTFPGKKIYAIIGGFHLVLTPEGEVRALAKRMEETGIECVVTGHCTGGRAYDILKKELGDKLMQLHCGFTLEI